MEPEVIRIRSRRHPRVVYEIVGDTCQCPASFYRRRCWHLAAAQAMRELGLVSAGAKKKKVN